MAKKPKKQPPVTLALLDETGLLTGYETGDAASADARRIPVPEGCDLAPGKYRWDGESFWPALFLKHKITGEMTADIVPPQVIERLADKKG